mgnify:CR=1 FL=1
MQWFRVVVAVKPKFMDYLQWRLTAFAAGLREGDRGLLHFRYRGDDLDVGRFTTKYPIGCAEGDRDWTP